MSKLTEILLNFYNEVEQDVHSDNNHDGIVITRAGTKAEQAINAYIAEVIGEDERGFYTRTDVPITEKDIDWFSEWAAVVAQNNLRAEQRKRAGL